MTDQPDLFGGRTACQRCQRPLQVAPKPNSPARLLKRSQTPRGYCINCAAHDWLRHTYPINLLLAEGSPERLLHPQVQAQFAAMMRAGEADADPAEIDWAVIVQQWDLPFPTRVRKSPQNPYTEDELAQEAQREPPWRRRRQSDPAGAVDPPDITSLDDLNQLEPGLGDDLRRALGGEPEEGRGGPPPTQPGRDA